MQSGSVISDKSFCPPSMKLSIETPAIADGNNPTTENTENRPPIFL